MCKILKPCSVEGVSTQTKMSRKIRLILVISRFELFKMELYQPKKQAGFRSGYGTNDHLQILKVLMEKTIKKTRAI